MSDRSPSPPPPSRGSRAPLIEAFGIQGLHGYRTVSLDSCYAATILIAKNGSGKTTLLSVLDAFMKCQYSRLRQLQFESIFCKFSDDPEQLVLYKSDLDEALSPPDTGDIMTLANRLDIPAAVMFRFVTEEWQTLQGSVEAFHENTTYSALARHYGFSRSKVDKMLSELQATAYDRNESISRIAKRTKATLRDYDIVYLPTYRRVELALRSDKRDLRTRRRAPRFDLAAGSLFTGDIQFGLSDISDRLSEMNERVAYESNSEYRKISAAIINELIDGSFENEGDLEDSIPSRDDLELLFSRVEQSRRLGPYYPVSIPNLDKLYSDEGVPRASRGFLKYFLQQLSKVIETTRSVELSVQQFVGVCNKYLASEESSTVIESERRPEGDSKRLSLDRSNLQVSVVSVATGRKIPLDALSSGEKQMISLFAKLYLYDGKKIVLIDEPELSLSIDWQREILVDVMNSPMCDQLIAITHSPFVFDNELEPFAGSLKLRMSARPLLDDDIDMEDYPFEDGPYEP